MALKAHTGKRLKVAADNRLYTVNDAKALALAGSSALALWSAKTKTTIRYEITRVPDDARRWWVKWVDGKNAHYLGVIEPTGFRLTARSHLKETAVEVRAFHYFWSHLEAGRMAPMLTARNDSTTGRCACCGRKLTDPASRGRGVGTACVETVLRSCA